MRLWLARGAAHLAAGAPGAAVRDFAEAVQLEPGSSAAHNNLGLALLSSGDSRGARASCLRAVALDPANAEAHQNLAAIHAGEGDLAAAVAAWSECLALMLGNAAARAQYFHFRARMCDWSVHEDFARVADTLGLDGAAAPPFAFLGLEDDPERLRRRTRAFAAHLSATVGAPELPVAERGDGVATPALAAGRRLRVGYVTGDLHDHATMHLLTGVLEHHEAGRLDVSVYAYNRRQHGAHADRVRRAVPCVHDMHRASDAEIVARARRDALDVAIDLKGYTQGARPAPFFARIAPIQIAYLGYPGTLGAKDIYDYLVADEVVLPPQARAACDEQILYLPDCYQPNDDLRPLPCQAASGRRAAHGLPETGVAMCCFNGAWKIGPREFDIWMRLLRRVDGAVLWLLDDNPWARDALRDAAEARGVCADRLVFAPRLDQTAHLNRLTLADLFLDTFACNAHTTASDAPWAGVPVVTRAGRQFAARVAASLCASTGLDDLVTGDDAAYEACALALASDHDRRARLRRQLEAGRAAAPLFDTARYTRALEKGFLAAHARHAAGRPPADIRIADLPPLA